jgi:16S rRNA (uracil1498-N3)-methyltransferase
MRDRFFVEGIHTVGGIIRFAADDARKLTTVLRKQSGDRVTVVDSGGTAYAATVSVDNRDVSATLDSVLDRAGVETTSRIVIAQGIPKGAKMDLIVEKATELGAAAIVPLRSARVEGERTGEHKIERWQRIAKSAAQQSGRTHVPQIAPIADWSALIATFTQYDRVYIPWELAQDATSLRERLESDVQGVSSILVIIGPEGGFSEEEVNRACSAGAIPISLGRRILRTETAALVVLAILLYARNEL